MSSIFFHNIFCNCKNILSYTVVIPMSVMLKQKMDDHASIALNGIGIIFGLLGVVAIFIQQSLTMFLPLLLPLVVCGVFCTLLINSQRNVKQTKENITPSPIRIDLIWYLDSQSWSLWGRFLFRHHLSERYWFDSQIACWGLSFSPSWNWNCEAYYRISLCSEAGTNSQRPSPSER